MPTQFTGGCMCGSVRYECTAAPLAMGNCHCRDCQKASGGAFVPVVAVPTSAVQISGEVNYYETVGDSGGQVRRGFCPNCGSRLFGRSAMAEIMGITAGSIDDPSWFTPQFDFYTDSAQPWDYMNPDLPKFAKLPPM